MREYHCEDCGYEGVCYGIPSSSCVSAPICNRCHRNGKLVPLNEWLSKNPVTRKEKAALGSIVAAIVIVIIVGMLYIAGGIWVYYEALGTEAPQHRGPYPEQSNSVLNPEQSNDRIPGDTRYMGLPPAPDCGHLYNQPGKHKAWAECMGVGYSRSKTDALLWSDREGLPPDCATMPRRGRIHEWRTYCTASGRN